MEPKIDLVAVSYNAPSETELFLESVATNLNVPFTLTVIDNNSPDPQVLTVLHRLEYDIRAKNSMAQNIHIIANESNDGYAKACNFGASLGSAPIIGLLNCDIQFLPDTAKKIVEAFYREDYQDVGVLGPLTTDEHGNITHAGIFRDPSGRDLHRGWHMSMGNRLIADLVRDEHDVPTVSGATYFVRRSMWNELTECPLYRKAAPGALGAFLPTPHFYEETFASYHAKAHKWRVRYQGDIHMIHSWHRSSPVGSKSLEPAETMFREACAIHGIELTF